MTTIRMFSLAAALGLIAAGAPLQAQQPPDQHSDPKGDHQGHPQDDRRPPPQHAQPQPQQQPQARPQPPQHAAPQARQDQRQRPEPQPQARVEQPRPQVVGPQRTYPQAVNPLHEGQQARPQVNPIHQGQQQSPQWQQQRIVQQQQRSREYQEGLDQSLRRMRDQSAVLEQQHRMAQYRVEQQYLANLRAEQARARADRNYASDPYYSAPDIYRYNRGGTYYQTNQYGAQLLRNAVNYGYQQGVMAGQADRQDGWTANYLNSYAYQDANYGYDGSYVPQADYNYYFRQGFQRGYQDGYAGRFQYGSASNGSYSILGSLVSGILGLQSIR